MKTTTFLAVLSTAAFVLAAPTTDLNERQSTDGISACVTKRLADGLEVRAPCPIPWTQNYGEYDDE